MGLQATLSILKSLPLDEAMPFLEAALAEPHPEVQEAAFSLLVDPAAYNRPDLIIQSYASLLPETRSKVQAQRYLFINLAKEKITSGREKDRRSAFEMLATFGEVEVAPLLALGINDSSTVIRDIAATALEKLALRYHYHLLNYHARQDPASKGFLDDNRAPMLEALDVMLRSFSVHRKNIFLDLAIESGSEAYNLLTDLVLRRQDTPVYRAFLAAMRVTHSESSLEMLFKLYFEKEERLHQTALELMRQRTDAAFAAGMGRYLARLPEEKFVQVASRTRDVPWWTAVSNHPDLEIAVAGRLMEFLAKSAVEARSRDSRIATFLKSRQPDLRIRALTQLHALKSPILPDLVRRLLEDPSDEVRVTAIKLLIDLNPTDKIRLLTPLVNATNPEVQKLAIAQLGKHSFERYMASFDSLTPRTRELAAKALSKIDPAITERLAEEITSPLADRRLRALQMIQFVGAEQDFRPLLHELLADKDIRVRATAIKIIGLSGSIEGMKILIGCLSEPDRRIRANAVEAFEEIGDTRFASLLLPFVKDPDNRVRANAAKALWNLGRHEVKDLLDEMLDDRDENMQLSAAWVIGEIAFPGAREMLLARLQGSIGERVRTKILEVIRSLESPPSATGGAA